MPLFRVLLATAALALAVGLATTDARSSDGCVTPTRGDRAPATAGRAIRMLYAYPSDGPDRSAALAAEMADDLAAIGEWWRSQDPTREPRFDVWESPCGATPDIGVLRLPYTAASLEPIAGRAARITDAVVAAGTGSPFTKYLVYYDGPAESSVCGQGNGQADGQATAVVFIGTCTAVPSALVAAHELLHALGGAPETGPPNECPGSPHHVCDSPEDILSPYAPRRPLSTTKLDVGRDDYYGHPGRWFDLRDSRWLRHVGRQARVTVVIDGDGKIFSEIPGVNCTRTCTSEWDIGTFVALEAIPAAGQRLVGWGGACDGAELCSFDVNGQTTIRARFEPARVRLALAVRGRGTIGAPGGPCADTCTRSVESHRRVTLHANPGPGWRFSRWLGVCAGRSARCTVATSAPVRAGAVFVKARRSA